MIDQPDGLKVPREPHELPFMLEQAANDAVADFNIWLWKFAHTTDTKNMPHQIEWLTLRSSIRKLEGVLAEIEEAR